MQSDREFQKISTAEKVHQQLGTKIANFADISEITAYLHKGKKMYFKTTKAEEITNFTDFRRKSLLMQIYMRINAKNHTFKINQSQESPSLDS